MFPLNYENQSRSVSTLLRPAFATSNVTCFDFPLLPHPSNVVSKVNNLVRRGWPHHTSCDLCHGRLTKMTMSTRVRVIIVALITDDRLECLIDGELVTDDCQLTSCLASSNTLHATSCSTVCLNFPKAAVTLVKDRKGDQRRG